MKYLDIPTRNTPPPVIWAFDTNPESSLYGARRLRFTKDRQSFYLPEKPVLPENSYYDFAGWAVFEVMLNSGELGVPKPDWSDAALVRGYLGSQTYGETTASASAHGGCVAVYTWPTAQKLTFDTSQVDFKTTEALTYECPLIENRACPSFFSQLDSHISFQEGLPPTMSALEAYNPDASSDNLGYAWVPSETYVTENSLVLGKSAYRYQPKNFPMMMPLDFVSKNIPHIPNWTILSSNPNEVFADPNWHTQNLVEDYADNWPVAGTWKCVIERAGVRSNAKVYLNDILVTEGYFTTMPDSVTGSEAHNPANNVNAQYLSFWTAGYEMDVLCEYLSPDFGLPYTA